MDAVTDKMAKLSLPSVTTSDAGELADGLAESGCGDVVFFRVGTKADSSAEENAEIVVLASKTADGPGNESVRSLFTVCPFMSSPCCVPVRVATKAPRKRRRISVMGVSDSSVFERDDEKGEGSEPPL